MLAGQAVAMSDPCAEEVDALATRHMNQNVAGRQLHELDHS